MRMQQGLDQRAKAAPRSAAVAAGGADLPLPAALRVLLQPGRLRGARRRSSPPRTGCACCARAASSARCSCGFSGGEPLMRDDLEILVAEARRLGYYTNLHHLRRRPHERRIAALKAAGLDHIQLSFQDSTREMNDFLSSTRTFELKSRVAELIKAHGYPMVLNVVLHRLNIDHVDRSSTWRVELRADYVELANTQYYGWAYAQPRAACCPRREQLRARRGSHRTACAQPRRQPHADLLRRSRLPRGPAQGVHERLGRGVPDASRPTASRCPATTRACCRAWSSPTCASSELRVDLVRLAGLQPLPRRRRG